MIPETDLFNPGERVTHPELGTGVVLDLLSFWLVEASKPQLSFEQSISLFRHAVEPTLHRELKHKGATKGEGSYSLELIGYVKIGAHSGLSQVMSEYPERIQYWPSPPPGEWE